MINMVHIRPALFSAFWLTVWLVLLFATQAPGHARPGDLAQTVELIVNDVTQLAIWVALWAAVTHNLQGQSRLAQHTSLAAATALIEVAVLGTAIPWTFFAIGWPWPASLFVMSRTLLIAIAGLFHLRLACQGLNTTRWALWLLATTLALSLTAARQWAEQNTQDALNQLKYQPNIYPATLIRTPAHGLEDGLKAMWDREWGQEEKTAQGD